MLSSAIIMKPQNFYYKTLLLLNRAMHHQKSLIFHLLNVLCILCLLKNILFTNFKFNRFILIVVLIIILIIVEPIIY